MKIGQVNGVFQIFYLLNFCLLILSISDEDSDISDYNYE